MTISYAHETNHPRQQVSPTHDQPPGAKRFGQFRPAKVGAACALKRDAKAGKISDLEVWRNFMIEQLAHLIHLMDSHHCSVMQLEKTTKSVFGGWFVCVPIWCALYFLQPIDRFPRV